MEDEIVSGKPLPPKITAVKALEDWKLKLTFTGGQERIFDMKTYRYGVFARLEEPEYFQRVRIVKGSLCWPHGQDLHYGMLYHNSNPLSFQE
ncbi:DUF2442 domain-containing protein [Fodinibius sediminis]|uniref:DUF2442 domain-containing protein n=1 Tax=Fodinibius sediminis TaxID=1214077 RepID=A0A521ATI9_9BACT|nr:DUF2442 domain-containing protein [Fodinibius sediminis]SMO38124.1 Protein of unknown function [Fodinibius sediminis]